MNTGIVSLPEFICKTLKNNRTGGFITSRGYRQPKARGLSARRLRDASGWCFWQRQRPVTYYNPKS